MKDWTGNLRRFDRRVRLLFAWRGLAVGASLGCALAAIDAILDWRRVRYSSWAELGVIVGTLALVGALAGYCRKTSPEKLAQSIDKRARLDNRLDTALSAGVGSPFDSLVGEDAETRLKALAAPAIFPIRITRMHVGALLSILLVGCLFILGNAPIGLSQQDQADRKDLKQAASQIERVLKPLEKHAKEGTLTPDERRWAEELQRLERDLKKQRLDKKEALEKANELANQAQQLEQTRADLSESALEKADTALSKMEKAELAKQGLQDANMDMAHQTEQQLASQKAQKQSEIQQLQQRLNDLQAKAGKGGMSKEEAEANKEQQQQIQAALAKAQQQLREIKLSEEARKTLEKFLSSKEFKELQALAAKLQKSSKQGKAGQPQQLTEEQLKQIEKKLEELAKKLATKEGMAEYLKQLRESLKHQGQCQCNGGIGFGLSASLGLSSGVGQMGPGQPSEDLYFPNMPHLNTERDALKTKGKTQEVMIQGQRQDKGEESYVEIKAPATLGKPSSVPYQKVLPQYRKKAEQAIDRQRIPKEHQKRVRDYFDSLGGN